MTRLGRPWPLLIAGSSAGLSLAILVAAPSAVRGVLALWFLLWSPGMAIAGLLEIEDLLAEVVVAVALSMAIGMLLALVMALTHRWSPNAALAILVVVSLAGAAEQARRGHERAR